MTECTRALWAERRAVLETIMNRVPNDTDWRGVCSINRRTEADHRIRRTIDNLAADMKVG